MTSLGSSNPATLLPSPPFLMTPRSSHGGREELSSENGYSGDEYDQMAELSDSWSSDISSSRPTTPSMHSGSHYTPSNHRSSTTPPPSNEPFSLAHKAERILGLTPGTLPHALAALQNARDEVRRTGDTITPVTKLPTPSSYGSTSRENSSNSNRGGKENGMRSRIDRARKVISVALPGGTPKIPGVVLGAGNTEEEESKRERRRRAVDGVLYWQKEVARLTEIEALRGGSLGMTPKKGRR